MSHKQFTLLLIVAAVVAAVLPSLVLGQKMMLPIEGDEAALIGVLEKADSPLFDKAKACQRLAVIGTKKCVPVLAAMLDDEKLAHYARFGLEPIPDPSVDDALRAALGKLEGPRLVGVINSIGNRGDAGAVGALKKLLADRDKQVAAAAAAALGRINTPECVDALKQALGGPADRRPAVGDACLTACDKLMAAGKRDTAAVLYEAMLRAKLPKYLQVAAAHGAIVSKGSAGLPRLVEYLGSDDKALLGVALSAAHELPAAEVAPAIVAELAKLKPAPEEARDIKLLTIVSAKYGAKDAWVDVTDKLTAAIRSNGLAVTSGNNLAGDPINGTVKELRVVYKLGDKEQTVVVPEKETLELQGDKVTAHPRQVVLISVLGELGDKAAMPIVLEATQAGPLDIRAAALRALATVGDRQAVPVLLEAAVEAPGELAVVARSSAAALKGEGVDAAIAAAMDKAQGKARAIIIDLVGRRGIRSTVPTLLKAADEKDEQVRLAAVGALGVTIGLDDFPALTKRLIAPASAVELAAVRAALKTASLRSPDREACADKLIAAMANAPVEARCVLVDVLGSVGGAKALVAVQAAAKDSNVEIQDAATRVLGQWMSVDAAPVLLDLAKTLKNNKFKTRALRGYIRIPRQLRVADDQKLAMLQEAMKVAWRDPERKLVLDALTRLPSPRTLAIIVEHLSSPGVKEAAGAAAVAIAEKIVKTHPVQVAQAMKQVLQAGANDDLTGRAKALLRQAEK